MPTIQLAANAPPKSPLARGRDLTLLRIAAKVHVAYLARSHRPPCTLKQELETLQVTYLNTIIRDAERLETAIQKNWATAADYQRESVRSMLQIMARQISEIKVGKDHVNPPVPSLGEVYHELVAAQEDFGEVKLVDQEEGLIVCVTTDAIMLDGVMLGRFRIDLVLGDMTEDSPLEWFRVLALNPNPPSNDDDVTHPHVSCERLCTGDAQYPITQALQDGRLSEFFCLVRSVLTTYNSGSAYVALDVWDGSICDDCGDSCPADEIFFCDRCEHDHCDSCMRCCHSCRMSYCRNCLQTCNFSEKWVCDECMVSCDDCGKSGLPDELEDGLCPTCFAKQEEAGEDDGGESDEVAVEPTSADKTPSSSPAPIVAEVTRHRRSRGKAHAAALHIERLIEEFDSADGQIDGSEGALQAVLGASVDQIGDPVIALARSL